MKKVLITTEDRESCENNEDVIKKTVILEAGEDSKVFATFEEKNAGYKIIV